MFRDMENGLRDCGGHGYESLIVRSYTNTEDYLEFIVSVINLCLFDIDGFLTYMSGTAGFTIMKDDRVIMSNKLSFIEQCREKSWQEFERVIIRRLDEMGYELDKESEYYCEIMK